jgi:hypothetical protein
MDLQAHKRLKLTAIGGHDVYTNSCSHTESMNCFARFGQRDGTGSCEPLQEVWPRGCGVVLIGRERDFAD